MKKRLFLIIIAILILTSISAFSQCPDDLDCDKIPDLWEKTHGLKFDRNDANLDYDNDGITNLREYELQLDPHRVDNVQDNKKSESAKEEVQLSPEKSSIIIPILSILGGLVLILSVYIYLRKRKMQTNTLSQYNEPQKFTNQPQPYTSYQHPYYQQSSFQKPMHPHQELKHQIHDIKNEALQAKQQIENVFEDIQQIPPKTMQSNNQPVQGQPTQEKTVESRDVFSKLHELRKKQ